MNVIIFGPPGAGKGTQSEFIVKKFNFFKLSTGDLLREEINKESTLGLKIKSIVNSGALVSDGIINNLIEKIVSNTIDLYASIKGIGGNSILSIDNLKFDNIYNNKLSIDKSNSELGFNAINKRNNFEKPNI